jgi:hypothetical protein
MTGAPKNISPHVVEFCAEISRLEPVYLPLTPTSRDVVNDCPSNVARHVAADGGEPVYGWKIWEWYGIMIEAEFHTIWRTASGTLRDVTPNAIPFEHVLFLADPKRTYEGQQVENIRKPLISDTRLQKFITIANEEFQILNEGDRAKQHEISISKAEVEKLRELQREKLSLQIAINQSTPGRNDPCRCGSGKKSKRCCFR